MGDEDQPSGRHILRELGFTLARDGDEMHGRAEVRPEMWAPGTEHLRTSILATWTDHAAGLLAVDVLGPRVPVTRVVRAAFARWNVEHAFRVAKGEAGLTHYEGRSYVGLMRHLVLCLAVVGFVALRAAELRGEKPGGDAGAGVPGAQRPVRRVARPGSGRSAGSARG